MRDVNAMVDYCVTRDDDDDDDDADETTRSADADRSEATGKGNSKDEDEDDAATLIRVDVSLWALVGAATLGMLML